MADKPRLCPQIGKACVREKCEAWYEGVVEVPQPNAEPIVKAHHACVIYFWTPMFLKGIANRTDGTQRAVESLRNNEDKGARLLRGAVEAATKIASSGNGQPRIVGES